MDSLRFTKGQGTGNDFVLLTDPDGALDLPPERVRVLAHRRFGVGGDGVIRAVRSAAIPDGAAVLDEDSSAEWFMDYRNADGSVAEMCGNGIRVFGEYLVAEGLADIAVGDTVAIGTRGGVKSLRRTEDGWAADLGAFTIDPGDELVAATGLDVDRPGLAIDMGNPHIVVALADDDELEALDLGRAPKVTPRPEHGANVEFVVPGEPLVVAGIGRIRMRVHERGSGETLSCGTGAAAAAVATRWWAGDSAPDSWEVRVPGGVLGVRMFGRGGVEHAELSGPAELMFTGDIEA